MCYVCADKLRHVTSVETERPTQSQQSTLLLLLTHFLWCHLQCALMQALTCMCLYVHVLLYLPPVVCADKLRHVTFVETERLTMAHVCEHVRMCSLCAHVCTCSCMCLCMCRQAAARHLCGDGAPDHPGRRRQQEPGVYKSETAHSSYHSFSSLWLSDAINCSFQH
jgi:hypothetical protein